MNVLKPFKQATILTLIQNGISQHAIFRKTGIDRKTIRKYQGLAPVEISNSPMATGSGNGISTKATIPKQALSHCLPHHGWIVGEVNKGRNAISIYQYLVERFGFTHRYISVKRYFRRLKKKNPGYKIPA